MIELVNVASFLPRALGPASNPRKTLGLCPPMSHLLIPAGVSRLNSVSDPSCSVPPVAAQRSWVVGFTSDASLRFHWQTSALAHRAKKGRAPCTWQPFTDASHALRSSFKTVLKIPTRLRWRPHGAAVIESPLTSIRWGD